MQLEELTGADKHDAKVKEEKRLKWQRRSEAIKALRAMKVKMPIALGAGGLLCQILREKGHGVKAGRYAISRMVKCRMYLYRIVRESHRYNLDGSLAEEISERDKEFALAELKRRKTNKSKQNKEI